MALKAGYYGLKKSVIDSLQSLASSVSGMKIIKSFGDGLTLTNAGKLNLTAAAVNKLGGIKVGTGLEIDDGVLSVSGADSFESLYDDTLVTAAGSIELSDDYTEYDMLIIKLEWFTGTPSGLDYCFYQVPVASFSEFTSAQAVLINIMTFQQVPAMVRMKKGADNTHLAFADFSNCGIKSIIGVKY